MRQLLVMCLLLAPTPVFSQQAAPVPAKQTIRPEFRDKVLQAIQDLDDIDVLKPEIVYAPARALARQSVMVVHRLALESPTPRLVEYGVCDELLAILGIIETSRIQQSYTNANSVAEFRKSNNDIIQHREKALTAVGFSTAYAHSRELTEPKAKGAP